MLVWAIRVDEIKQQFWLVLLVELSSKGGTKSESPLLNLVIHRVELLFCYHFNCRRE